MFSQNKMRKLIQVKRQERLIWLEMWTEKPLVLVCRWSLAKIG